MSPELTTNRFFCIFWVFFVMFTICDGFSYHALVILVGGSSGYVSFNSIFLQVLTVVTVASLVPSLSLFRDVDDNELLIPSSLVPYILVILCSFAEGFYDVLS